MRRPILGWVAALAILAIAGIWYLGRPEQPVASPAAGRAPPPDFQRPLPADNRASPLPPPPAIALTYPKVIDPPPSGPKDGVVTPGGAPPEMLVAYEQPPLPLGRSFAIRAGVHMWGFRAHPGEKYRLRARWPDGDLELRVGSSHRDKEEFDNDDDEDVVLAPIEKVGPHEWSASWVIGPKANTGILSTVLSGKGVDPIELEIDRE